MASLKEAAQAYEAPERTGNIAELPSVSTDMQIEEREVIPQNGGNKFSYSYIVVDGKEYRVPKTVIRSIKAILEDNPNLKTFKVKRTGTTKDDTTYTVIPLS